MRIEEIKEKVEQYRSEGKRLFVTSSFQSHSLVILHIISRIDNSIPVVFINTGYHFPETIAFRDKITKLFDLKMFDLRSDMPRYMQKGTDGKLLFTSDPDHCCYLNKTQPLEKWLMKNDIWINGVRADQSAARAAMEVEQKAPFNTIRFHPMLDWNAKMIWDYRKKYNLPEHPMENRGYMSIGCEPCTRKIDPELQERESRWYGMNKTECGLHVDLINK